MKKQLKIYQERHLEVILKEMSEYHFRFRRFNGIFTAILFYGDGLLEDAQISETIRVTDHFFRLEENLFLLIFGETGGEDGIIAAERLLPKLAHSPQQDIYASAVECSKEKEQILLVHELFTILDYAIEHHHINCVLDSGSLDSIY